MSFFSTSDILKSLISGSLFQEVVNRNEFKIAMNQFDVDKYVGPELIQQVINNLFENQEVRKQLREIIVEIVKEELTQINNDSQTR